MNYDPEVEKKDSWSDDSADSANRKRIESRKSNILLFLLGVFIVLIIGGGIFYFLSNRSTDSKAISLESKVTALEEKIVGIERQLAELPGKIAASGPDPALLGRVDALAREVEALKKQKKSTVELKAKPLPPSKPAISTAKKYHTVQKGETLNQISKKYGMSVDNIRKLNNLSSAQSLRIGQKLLVSPQR